MAGKTSDFARKCRRYAAGRVGARKMMIGKTLEQAISLGPRWRPTIARDLFEPSNKDGYETRAEAIEDAKKIKARLAAALASLDQESGQ